MDIDLIDEYKMIIDDDNVGIVTQYKNCSHFFLELVMDYQHKEISILVEVVQLIPNIKGYVTSQISQSLPNFLLSIAEYH